MISRRTDGNIGINSDFYVGDLGPISTITSANSNDIKSVLYDVLPTIANTNQGNSNNNIEISNAIQLVTNVTNQTKEDVARISGIQYSLSTDNVTIKSNITSLQNNIVDKSSNQIIYRNKTFKDG